MIVSCIVIVVIVSLIFYIVPKYWNAFKYFSGHFFTNAMSVDTLTHSKDLNICSSLDCVRCSKFKLIMTRSHERMEDLLIRGHVQQSQVERLLLGIRNSQASISSTIVSPQRPTMLYVPRLTSKPWWRKSLIKDLSLLESNFSDIFDEFTNVYDNSSEIYRWANNTTQGGSWSIFSLINQGHVVKDNCRLCPVTTNTVLSVTPFMSGCIFGNAVFSVIDPNTLVTEHYGPTNTRLRCHLGLKVPRGCFLRVDGSDKQWQEGKVTVFDDSFLHSAHYTKACSNERRAVLMIDLWHPDLTTEEIQAMQYIYSPND